MANSTQGSHTGSFAGGFIKAFMAMMQMGLRARQQENMNKFYGMMMQQMKHNMDADTARQATIDRLTPRSPDDFTRRVGEGGGDTTGKFKIADLTKMAEKAGFKGSDAARMAAISAAESNGNPDAVGKAGEIGLTQINPHAWSAEDIATAKDPQGAFNVAYKVFQKQGWGAWSTDPSSPNFTPRNSMEKFLGTAKDAAGVKTSAAIDNRDSTQAKTFLASVSAHSDRPGDTSNMKPEFATRMASAIKQANAEGIPVRLESGFREPGQLLAQGDRSKAAYFDASGQSKHSDGSAGDVAGIGQPNSATARRWAEIASANGLAVPYGYDNAKEYNHTELAGLTPLRGAQPVNAARSLVAGPGAASGPAPAPKTPYTPSGDPGPGSSSGQTAVGTPGSGQGVDAPGFGGAPAPTPAPTPAPAPAPAAPIPARGAPPVPLGPVPGTMQSNVGGVRGQQPGTGGPIITTGQFGQQQIQPQPQAPAAPPAPAIPTRTGDLTRPLPPPDPRHGQRPQQVPLSDTPLPPPRPDSAGAATDTSGAIVPGASQDTASASASYGSDPLWAGYQGASPDQAASADPLNSLYASGQNFAASSGLTDTTGLMAAGLMAQQANSEEDLTANLYRGGPVIRYRRGGVVGFARGGDTDEDMLGEYGGTDTDDPMANVYWDQQRVAQLTNNSEGSTPDLTTSIQNRAAQPQQGDPPLAVPPPPDTSIGEPPEAAQPAADQPAAAPPSEDTTAPQPAATSQSDIPPGSVQVAGPGGWGSVKSDTTFPLPRMGSMGGGMRMPHPSMSMLTGGRSGRVAKVGALGHQELYIPDHVGDQDFNHLGIAPTHNEDGTPGPWLLNMVDNGVRALFTGFGFANQGAMPNSPDAAQKAQQFLDNNSSGLTKQDMSQLGDMYDPKHQLYEGGRDIAGAVGMIKYYALTGQLDAASRLSGGVLLYTRMVAMEHGDAAVKYLFDGDYKNAVKSLETGYNWVPDGKTAEATDIDPKTGKVHAVQKDGNGKVIAEQDYLPAAIMKAALGLKDGTGYWNMLSSVARAGGNDPMGSHYETQRLLRGIQGNENVPLPPLAAQAAPKDGTLPITAPDQTQPSSPDSVSNPPDADAPPAAPDTSVTPPDTTTAPPIPDRNVGPNQNVGQAAPPPTDSPIAQPPQAMATRSDTVPPNLVAGPGASPAIQPQPVSTGGSGAVLVAQQQQRELQAQQSKAVDRMIQGGRFDGDDPYVQQKIADIQQRNFGKIQAQRTAMEQQFADIEGADISPTEKRSLQVALQAKLKNFDETVYKPAIGVAKQEYAQFASGLKQQFTAKMAIVKRQQKLDDEANTYDNQRVAAEQKRQAARDVNDPQIRANEGVESDGSPVINKVTGEIIKGYGEQLEGNLSDKDTTTNNYANPITRYAQRGNPWLSSGTTIDPKTGKVDPTSFDPSKIDAELYNPTNRKTAVMASNDILNYNRDITFRDAQDITNGVMTGAYAISEPQAHPPIHSRVLGDLPNDDGVPRVDVYIRRGLGDNNPMKVTMSTANAKRLFDMSQKADHVSKYNHDIAIAHGMPDDKVYSSGSPAIAPETPPAPNSSTSSQVQQPPPQQTALPPRQTPTPFTPNGVQQPSYDIPTGEPTVMDWFRSHTRVAPPAAKTLYN